MNMTSKTLLRFATLSLVASLSACGGGGGDAAPSEPTVIASSGNVKTSVPAGTHAAGSVEGNFFTALNNVRLAAGAGMLTQNAKIDVAAIAHGKYIWRNITAVTDFHIEDPTEDIFYAVTFSDRLVKAGYSAAAAVEVIGGTGPEKPTTDCLPGLLGTAYRGPALLSRHTDIGVGEGQDGWGVPLCVANLATPTGDTLGQVPATGALVAYPTNGRTQVPDTFDVASETPRPPAALLPNATAGTPVIVSVRNADYVNYAAAGTLNATITAFNLKDAAGTAVSAVILAHKDLKGSGVTLNSDTNLSDGFAVLVPLAPLNKGQTYTATFAATLRTGGASLTKTWSFTTNP
jgi:hypothetical protein